MKNQPLKKYMRNIDKVCFKESINKPHGLFTIDVDYDNLPPSKDPDSYGFNLKQLRDLGLEKKLFIQNFIDENEFEADLHIESNKDLFLITEFRNEEF